jgi:hypothetical protein
MLADVSAPGRISFVWDQFAPGCLAQDFYAPGIGIYPGEFVFWKRSL